MFPGEKANDYSLLELHEKLLNPKRAWFSSENAIMFIDWQGGQIRSSVAEADACQWSELHAPFPLEGVKAGWRQCLLTPL
jgi:hypothetical protein